MQRFNTLNEEELKELTKAPMYVGLLIAYADKSCDAKELEWIEKVTLFRIKTAHSTLRDYYRLANEYIKENMNLFISELPSENDQIMSLLVKKLENTKTLLNKLDERMADRLIDSYKSMALSIAEVDGGVINFFTMNADEEKYISLHMLD